MSAAVARSVMTLAARCLGDRRRGWALAMRAEFEWALRDGRALGFAFGCLAAAWREMPAHGEGRFALASHAVALGVILPVAALLSSAALLGFPYVDIEGAGVRGVLAGSGGRLFLLNEGSRVAVPSLTLLMLLIAGTHLLVAWRVLERDWERVAASARLGAATTVTLALVSGVAALGTTRMVPLVAVLAIELTIVSAVARWHALISDGSASEELGVRV